MITQTGCVLFTNPGPHFLIFNFCCCTVRDADVNGCFRACSDFTSVLLKVNIYVTATYPFK